MILGMVMPPGMFHLTGAMNGQTDLFKSAYASLLSSADIIIAATANPAIILIDPDGAPNATISVTWPMLPIYPKIAVLFHQGRSLMTGFQVGSDILAMIPAQLIEERELWEGQLRLGLTSTGPVAAQSTSMSTSTASGSTAPAPQRSGSTAPAANLLIDATVELVQQMTDQLALTAVSTSRSTSRPYDWVELEYLFERVGLTRPFTGRGVESLPFFLKEFVAVRVDKSNTRMFLERYRRNHLSHEIMGYEFVLTT
jgi:hypothetical protein